MCGIVLIVGSDIDYKLKNVFKDLLILDTIRGVHSTGVLSVSKGKTNVLKKAVDGVTFTDMKRFDKFMVRAVNPTLLLGHNRAATAGRVSDTNAHPFSDGDTHLVHNGTLKGYSSLYNSKETDVDSEAICFDVEKNGILKTVSKLDGAFALATYNEKSQVFSVIRNKERPLWGANVKGKDAIIFASESAFITAAANRNGVELAEEPWFLKEQSLIEFHLDDKTNVSGLYITDDVEFYKRPVYKSTNNWRSQQRKKDQTVIPFKKKDGVTTTTMTTTLQDSSRKERLANTSNKLATLGLVLSQTIVAQVEEFKFFHKQKGPDGTGTVTLSWFDSDDAHKVVKMQSFTIKHKEFLKLKDDFVWCKVVGVTERDIGKEGKSAHCPIVTVGKILTNKDHDEFWSLFKYDSDQIEEESNTKQITLDGKPCSENEFKVGVKNGCGVCSSSIPSADHSSITWVMNEPMCKGCTNEFVLESKRTGFSIEELLTT